MYKSIYNNKGFTLIELLVVVAIIGLLASVVLTSLGTARSRGRDTQRISDVRQLRNALQLYFNDNSGQYPTTLAALTSGPTKYITAIPKDPLGGAVGSGSCRSDYCYAYGPGQASFHLGVQLENGNTVLNSDKDFDSTVVAGWAPSGAGCASTNNCVFKGNLGPDFIYDVTP